MVIAMLAPGNSVHTVRWAKAFTQRGHSVYLITQHAPLPDLSPEVQVHRLPHGSGAGYALNGSRLKGILRTIKPDVVNAHYATGYGLLARWAKPFPVVLNVWGSDVFAFPEKSAAHRRLLRKNLAAADRIVSTSEAMAEQTRRYVQAQSPITVVPFGVDMDLFKPRATERMAGTIAIGTVKALEPVYGVDILLEAFIQLGNMEQMPPVTLHVVGGGSEEMKLRQRAKAAGVEDRVHFLGQVPNTKVPEILRQLDVFVALSRAESFGVAVVEASACGLPVAASRVGGLPEVVQDQETGFLVPSEDVEAAAVALAKLVRSPELRHLMGRQGREFVARRFEWGHCVDEQLVVLAETAAMKKQ